MVTTPEVAADTSACLTCAGVAVGVFSRTRAAAPATCGDAIEVPSMVLVAVVLVDQAEVMALPGAKIETQDPKFENEERASVLVVEPTISASVTRAGE